MTQAKLFRTIGLTAMLATVAIAPARADIITALASSTAIAGGYAYTYQVQLSGGQLDATTNGNPVQFGTVYDFGPSFGDITTTGYLGMFSFALQATSTPAALTSPTDSPNRLNIRFTYMGSNNFSVAGEDTTNATSIQLPTGNDNLGTFTINSPYGPVLGTTAYDGQSYKGSNDTQQSNVGSLSSPALPADVPEPATLALLGAGLLGAGLARRRSR